MFRVGTLTLWAAAVGMLGCKPSQPDDTVRTTASADTVATFSVNLPVGESPSTIFAGTGTGALILDTGVTVADPSGSVTLVSGGGVNVGTQAVVGDKASNTTGNLISVGLVTLENKAEVTGSVTTTLAPVVPKHAAIDGTVSIQSNLSLTGQSWTVSFPTATLGDVTLGPKATQTLAPGAYGSVSLGPSSTLVLSAGTYTFVSLDVQPNAVIQCDTTAAPLALYVQTSLSLQGTIAASTGAAGLLLGYTGTSPVAVQSAFNGTLVAPSASVTLHPHTQNSGAFFAQSLEVFPHASLVHVPFSGWGKAVSAHPQPVAPDVSQMAPAVPPPPLATASDVQGFLQWAYQSRPSQVDATRALILAQVGNESIGSAIVAILQNDLDQGRNLVGISVLGELKTQAGMTYFTTLITTPLPTTGTIVSTSLIPLEAQDLASRQARAVDGVAMMMTQASDALLLSTISNAQSTVVRARAVHDYLFIHGPAGRAKVSPLLSADQQIFMDRIDMAGFGGSYDTRLAAYLAQHPEVVPPPVVINPH